MQLAQEPFVKALHLVHVDFRVQLQLLGELVRRLFLFVQINNFLNLAFVKFGLAHAFDGVSQIGHRLRLMVKC